MIKKSYLRPTTNVKEVGIAQLVCVSLQSVNSNGLDTNESLNYGDEEAKVKNVWDDAW